MHLVELRAINYAVPQIQASKLDSCVKIPRVYPRAPQTFPVPALARPKFMSNSAGLFPRVGIYPRTSVWMFMKRCCMGPASQHAGSDEVTNTHT